MCVFDPYLSLADPRPHSLGRLSSLKHVQAGFGSLAHPFANFSQPPALGHKQVHGAQVAWVQNPEAVQVLGECDALVTGLLRRSIGVRTADCVPILAAHTSLHWVMAIHAGWRGLLAGVIEASFATWQQKIGGKISDWVAAIGPCTGACCYEVGQDLADRFCSHFAARFDPTPGIRIAEPTAQAIGLPRRVYLDPGFFAGEILSELGIPWDRSPSCTYHSMKDGRYTYASYRRATHLSQASLEKGQGEGEQVANVQVRQWSIIELVDLV
jgi:YfiH family protein